ncbi:hypothetical protein SAMN05216359_105286 [Roseateles sp. YR242]|nr:hypothetical protein [Roseateles sp. YR242]SEL12535.1 hypothetical protein SAMN05216359_105286 [Roseateles sp. YR242]
MRDLPANIFAGCFVAAMCVFLPLVIFCLLVAEAWRALVSHARMPK